jgi:hypothetical protein
MDRRDCLKLIASAVAFRHVAGCGLPTTVPAPGLTASDITFLDDMQQRACLYFAEQAGATTGQVLDRAAFANSTGQIDPRPMASIAATGFGLTALCIADQRGYQPHAQILAQVRRTLQFHANTLPNVHGFFYHFNDVNTGARYAACELSPIDTSLLLCGVLTARAYFNTDAEIVQLATTIYNRVDWPWMLNGGAAFAMGWSPESGFQTGRWNHYCELMMLYLLALGSPTHPIDASSWDAFTRPTLSYGGLTWIGANDPLFVHQYSHAWFDFRNKSDKYANYFTNSVTATRAHEAWCIAQGAPYSQDYWGISASDSAHGYTAWGGPSTTGGSYGGVDGSVVPNATAGSLPFVPADCVRLLRALKQNYPQSYGRYSFCDAFHPAANWYDPDVLGIDLGISVVMAENARSSLVWNTFARNPEVAVAMQKAGFKSS